MKKLQTTTLAALAAVMFLAAAVMPAQAKMSLKFGHVGAPGSLFALSAEEFARRANEKLGDQAEVVVFGASQLGNDQAMMQKLKLGQVDLSLPSSIMSSVADEFGVFEMPYLIQDREHMKRVGDAMLESTFAPAAEAEGYRILAVWENGFRHITNNKRPIVMPADLEGIKLRTPRGAWRLKMFQTYGANPTPMALSEVFTALQTNVIDGQENPFAQIYSSKFQEVQKYLSLSRHVYTPAYVAVGSQRFAGLPEDVQRILIETAQEMQPWVYETATRLEDELLAKLRETMEVNEVDSTAFIEASQPVYEEFASSVEGGPEMVDTIRGLAKGS